MDVLIKFEKKLSKSFDKCSSKYCEYARATATDRRSDIVETLFILPV